MISRSDKIILEVLRKKIYPDTLSFDLLSRQTNLTSENLHERIKVLEAQGLVRGIYGMGKKEPSFIGILPAGISILESEPNLKGKTKNIILQHVKWVVGAIVAGLIALVLASLFGSQIDAWLNPAKLVFHSTLSISTVNFANKGYYNIGDFEITNEGKTWANITRVVIYSDTRGVLNFTPTGDSTLIFGYNLQPGQSIHLAAAAESPNASPLSEKLKIIIYLQNGKQESDFIKTVTWMNVSFPPGVNSVTIAHG